MGKRKAVIVSDDDDDDDGFNPSDEEKPKVGISQAVKDEDETDELERGEGRPLAKKVKAEKRSDQNADGTDVIVRCTSDGDKYIDLGKKKRATVRSYKGNVFVDIREFYGADGDEKPGKKGVSLNLDQWEALKGSSGIIDHLFAEQKK